MAGATGAFEFAAFVKGMQEAKPFLEALGLADIREQAEQIAEVARELAPVGTPEEGDPHPGAMRDDIAVREEGIDAKGPYVDVGTVEPYGLYVEFGTENIAAEPFMRPAIAQVTGAAGMSSRVNLAPRKRAKA